MLLSAAGLLRSGNRPMYDWLLRTRGTRHVSRVVLLPIDDKVYKALGGRNPDRAQIAAVVSHLWSSHADLIVLDLLFLSTKTSSGDRSLQSALQESQCVLACSPAQDLYPLQRFASQAVGVGSADLKPDPDGIFRGLPPPYVGSGNGHLVITSLPLALECAKLVWFPSGNAPAHFKGGDLFLGRHRYALSHGRWLIPFEGGAGTLPTLSFMDALQKPTALPDLTGKIILVGYTRPTEHDFFSVPLPAKTGRFEDFKAVSSNTMAGVEIHGQALAAMLAGKSIRTLRPQSEHILFLLLFLFWAVVALVPLRPIHAIPTWAVFALGAVGSAVWAIRHGIALPLFSLLVGWALYASASFGYHRYRDFSARRAVERLFGRYVSPNIARQLLADPSLVHAGGRKKTLTILFSDIRGFTALSEGVAPEQVTLILNRYFTAMMDILYRYDGTYDKFIGDALLAFFGDPVDQSDHAGRAVACAQAMQAKASELRREFEESGLPPLHIGIAVHTGPVVVGNHGSRDNWTYTVIGDAVNLASRLQGSARSDEVIVTESTAGRIPGFQALYLVSEPQSMKVKGRSEPVRIYRVLGEKKEEERS
ncbi:MAG: adenylate/guanylate cyclase domain-containing protein [Acidobacteriota bacterium]